MIPGHCIIEYNIDYYGNASHYVDKIVVHKSRLSLCYRYVMLRLMKISTLLRITSLLVSRLILNLRASVVSVSTSGDRVLFRAAWVSSAGCPFDLSCISHLSYVPI
jgi:hypothetical protein